MNAERLLAHYERIADAPDAIGRLRRFILDLAVRGRLVPQDAKDEPAAELLKRIAKEKLRSGNGRDFKRASGEVGLITPPFELPKMWVWTTFGEVQRLVRGVTYSKSDVSETPGHDFVPVLRANNIGSQLTHDEPVYVNRQRVSEDQFLRAGDFMIALSSGSKNLVGKAAFVPEDYQEAFGGFCGVLRLFDPSIQGFVRIFLRGDLYRSSIAAGSRGIGINNLKTETISSLFFPIPPLAEQHRIVAKVDELMALCDRLEVARAEREAARDRLSASSLARLNAPDPDTFQADARFVLNALPAFTARPDQIKQLRQTILNLAVRGMLVPQDPEDEPVQALLKRVGVNPSAKEASAVENVPSTWRCLALDQLAIVGTGTTPPRGIAEYYSPPAIPWVTSGETRTPFILGTTQFVSERALKETSLKLYPCGTLIVAMYGQGKTRGQITELCIEATTNQACAAIVLKLNDEIHRRYIKIYFQKIYDEIREEAAGGAQPNLNLAKVKATTIPLPPLPEQHRIVTKVDELMALCDQLEASLNDSSATRSRLLGSLLAESLEPAEPVAA